MFRCLQTKINHCGIGPQYMVELCRSWTPETKSMGMNFSGRLYNMLALQNENISMKSHTGCPKIKCHMHNFIFELDYETILFTITDLYYKYYCDYFQYYYNYYYYYYYLKFFITERTYKLLMHVWATIFSDSIRTWNYTWLY